MDVDWRRFYRINLVLMKSVGLWPSSHSILSNIYRALMYFVLVTGVLLQFVYMIRVNPNFNTAISILATCIPTFVLLMKYIGFHLKISELEPLIEKVGENWDAVIGQKSKEILADFTRIGRLCTIYLTILFYSLISAVAVLLHVPYVLDVLAPLNHSRPQPTVMLVDYIFFDHKNYRLVRTWHMVLILMVGMTTVLASESFMMILVQHACALFRIAGYQISSAMDDSVLRMPDFERDTKILNRLVDAIRLHLTAIKFSDLVWSTFAVTYMLLIVPGIVSFSINLFRVSQLLTRVDHVVDLLVSSVFTSAHLMYMYLCCLFGQRLIDHSSDVFHQIYDSRWYEASVLVQKSYLFVMHRSMKYTLFVLAGIFVVSLEGFTTLSSMAVSYYVMLHSL